MRELRTRWRGITLSACTYYSKAARALLLVVASFAGLQTDSCAEALTFVMEQDAGTDEAVDVSMWKRLGEAWCHLPG